MRPATDATDYPPIGDYAAIGDCRTVALVSRQGSIDWLCLPHFSSPSVFAALLDRRRGGRFAVRPAAPFRTERAYIDGTNVLATDFVTASGRMRLIDLMPIKTRGDRALEPDREILRIVQGLEGETEIEILFEPAPDYGRSAARLDRRGRLGWFFEHGGEAFALRTEVELTPDPGASRLTARIGLRAGETIRLSFLHVINDMLVMAPLGTAADRRVAETIAWWRRWSGQCTYEHRHRAAVLRSVLALKLLTFAPSGAVVAAATTSLPEAVGAGRNWDYRYCWLRDAATTLAAFFDIGFQREGEAYLGWLMHSTRLTQPDLMVLYDVYGRTDLRQGELDHLEGYRGSRPVRIGNDAIEQLQLDVYGSVVRGATLFAERGGTLMRDQKRMLRGLGRIVAKRWREPDHGLWEIPGMPRHYLHSKLMCWSALDCLLRLHEYGKVDVPAAELRAERDAIRDMIEAHGFDPKQQSYVGVLGESALDAAMLTMARVGYRAAADARVASTLDRIRQQLGEDGMLRRYAPGFDGIPSTEGAFGICGYWVVELLAEQGRIEEANELFERLLALGNDVGLMAEEYDPKSGAALGNFPQAYTHAGLINAALALCAAGRASDGKG